MGLGNSLGILGAGAVWRTLGSAQAGRTLMRALGSDDEDTRTLAGMLLVKGGERAEPLLLEAVARRENLPLAVTLLGSVGGEDCESTLRQLRDDSDEAVAKAARSAVQVLDLRAGKAPGGRGG